MYCLIKNKFRRQVLFAFILIVSCPCSVIATDVLSEKTGAENRSIVQLQREPSDFKQFLPELSAWLENHRDPKTGLPYSHVGDKRFERWTITYDSAVTALAYIALDDIDSARRSIDYYIDTQSVWRLNGVIEAFIPGDLVQGKDWSVRTGANIWLGLASFHLYSRTGEEKYLDLSKKIVKLCLSLQNINKNDPNFGGISLGPKGDPQFKGDQYLSYNLSMPQYKDIYSTEVNIDAYTLVKFLYQKTGDATYKTAMNDIFVWLRTNGYNKTVKRFNRGYNDPTFATDVQSWAISAFGIDGLNAFAQDLAENLADLIELKALSQVTYTRQDSCKVNVRGIDFIEKERARKIFRQPLVSPEWTFQYINALERISRDYMDKGLMAKASLYDKKKNELFAEIFKMAEKDQSGLGFPYASQANKIIGHEHRTPARNNLSTIGVAYGILAVKKVDPFYLSDEEKQTRQ